MTYKFSLNSKNVLFSFLEVVSASSPPSKASAHLLGPLFSTWAFWSSNEALKCVSFSTKKMPHSCLCSYQNHVYHLYWSIMRFHSNPFSLFYLFCSIPFYSIIPSIIPFHSILFYSTISFIWSKASSGPLRTNWSFDIYKVVVLGTGLVESIVAAAAARGKLSPSDYYRKKRRFSSLLFGLHNIWVEKLRLDDKTQERKTNPG